MRMGSAQDDGEAVGVLVRLRVISGGGCYTGVERFFECLSRRYAFNIERRTVSGEIRANRIDDSLDSHVGPGVESSTPSRHGRVNYEVLTIVTDNEGWLFGLLYCSRYSTFIMTIG